MDHPTTKRSAAKKRQDQNKKYLISALLLKCPICVETPENKVYQCENGHVICGKCILKMKTCPRCSVAYQPKPIRNLLAEAVLNIVDLPCPFKLCGCPQSMKREGLVQHQTVCNFRPVKFCENLGYYNCHFAYSIGDEVRQHLEANHPNLTITLDSNQSWSFTDIFNATKWERYPEAGTFYLTKEMFVVNCRVTKFGPNGQTLFSCATFYFGEDPKRVIDHWVTISVHLVQTDEKMTKTLNKSVRTWGGYPQYFKNVDDEKLLQWFDLPIDDVNYLKTYVNPATDLSYDLEFSFEVEPEKKN